MKTKRTIPNLEFLPRLKPEEIRDICTLLLEAFVSLQETLQYRNPSLVVEAQKKLGEILKAIEMYETAAGVHKVIAVENIRKTGEWLLSTIYDIRDNVLSVEEPKVSTSKTPKKK